MLKKKMRTQYIFVGKVKLTLYLPADLLGQVHPSLSKKIRNVA